ncbi:hypothetical protein [Streptomyces sp. LaPpAH-108]|uniref:hypothetical protein n=1 Tax=Streptomyces sp. LaPpAH-108 TaxID=1155714 RepID=UPI00035D6644|nr:hypothetical protein [Streptomyces sp. LaPpAH-108]
MNDEQPTPPDPLGLAALLESDAVARLRQLALLNFGEMNAVKVSAGFDMPLEHGAFSDDFMEAVRAVFVAPEVGAVGDADFDALYRSWKQPGSITVLAEGPGKGRTTTARALLAELRHEHPDVQVGQLGFGASPDFPAHRIPHTTDWAYVLELPPDEDGFAVADTFGANLGQLRDHLARRRARLVVLTTPEQWRRIGTGAPEGTRQHLGTPPPLEIARSWLRAESPGFPVERWLQDRDIAALLEGQPPVDVLEIVGHILHAHRSNDSRLPNLETLARKYRREDGTPFDRQVLSVLAARSNWRVQLLSWHRKHGRTSFQRNFLLSCAALRGAPVAHLYTGAADLGRQLGEGDVALDGQREPGVIEMVDSIDAELAEDDTVTFDRPDWDDAALEYFWVDRPLSRTGFLTWLAEAPLKTDRRALDTLSAAQQRAMALRIGSFAVQWAVRQRRQEPLRVLARAWKGKAPWPWFVEVLTSASVHTASASYLHEMLLQWARDGDAAQRLAVVQVCAGEFGRQHTVKALTRLRHAARAQDPEVRVALRQAVEALWSEPTARRTLFAYVVSWCGTEATREAGRETFRTLAATTDDDAADLPVLLTRDGASDFTPSTADLTTGWRAVLRGARGLGPDDPDDPDDADATAVRLWLDAARRYPGLLGEVLSVLATAVRTEADEEPAACAESPRDRLRAIVRTWARTPDPEASSPDAAELPDRAPSRADVYAALTQQLDDGLVDGFRSRLTRADEAGAPA